MSLQQQIQINNKSIGSGYPVYIVAEMSANHKQNFDIATQLIHEAKWAGADAIKVQTYTPDTMTIDCGNKEFLHESSSIWANRTLYNLYSEAYMPWEWQPKLKNIANDIGLDFFSTPFDKTAVDFLETMDVPAYKIASHELVDVPLLKYVAGTNKPVILSTGMASFMEISQAVNTLYFAGCNEIILLKCTSAYPAPRNEMNLRTIPAMKIFFYGHPIGLSDHSIGILAPVIATALGANIIEKHIMLSQSSKGLDSEFSLGPTEFKEMVEAIRSTEQTMGSTSREPTPAELCDRKRRRSLYIVEDIKKGDILTKYNVRSIRPGLGLHTKYFTKVIGQQVVVDISKGTPLNWNLIK